MKIQQEEQLVLAFSKEIKETFFHHIQQSQWKVEQITEHYWLLGVRNEQIETYPFLYSIHFDWKNRVFTLRLEQEVAKSTYLFPHVYYRFLHFLKEQSYDVFIRNDNFSLKKSLYKRKQTPLHATGEGAKRALALLQTLKDEIESGKFYFWKEQNMIHFSTPMIPNLYHAVQLFIDEKEQPTQGVIELKGQLIKDERDIRQYCREIKIQLEEMQKKEHEIIDYLAKLHKNNYYDPFSESLYIFKKNIPFSIKLLVDEKENTSYTYAVRFGSATKRSSSLPSLIEEVKKDLHDYVIRDRLRAVVEGRI